MTDAVVGAPTADDMLDDGDEEQTRHALQREVPNTYDQPTGWRLAARYLLLVVVALVVAAGRRVGKAALPNATFRAAPGRCCCMSFMFWSSIVAKCSC